MGNKHSPADLENLPFYKLKTLIQTAKLTKDAENYLLQNKVESPLLVTRFLAKNPNLSAKTQLKLDLYYATIPNLKLKTQDEIIKHGSVADVESLAKNPSLTSKMQLKIHTISTKNNYSDAQWELAKNPNLCLELKKHYLENIVKLDYYTIAQNPSLSEKTMQELKNTDDLKILKSLAQNLNLPSALQKELYKNKNLQLSLIRNQSLSLELQQKFLKNTNISLEWCDLAKHSTYETIQTEIINKAAKLLKKQPYPMPNMPHGNSKLIGLSILNNLSGNKNLSISVQEKLTKHHSSDNDLIYLAYNPKLELSIKLSGTFLQKNYPDYIKDIVKEEKLTTDDNKLLLQLLSKEKSLQETLEIIKLLN